MTLAEARERVRLLINEKSAAQWSNDEIDDFIAHANAEVYSLICSATPDYFRKRVRVTYPSETFSITLDTATDSITSAAVGRWEKILAVFALPSNDDISTANLPVPLEPATGLSELWANGGSLAADPYLQDQSLVGVGYYLIQQRELIVSPLQTSDSYLWIHLVPSVHTPANDAEHLLSVDAGVTGELTQHHDFICHLAALDVLNSIMVQAPYLAQRMLAKRAVMYSALGFQQQIQAASHTVDARGV